MQFNGKTITAFGGFSSVPSTGGVYKVSTADGEKVDATFHNITEAFFAGQVVTLTEEISPSETRVYICTGFEATTSGQQVLWFTCAKADPTKDGGGVVIVRGLWHVQFDGSGLLNPAETYPIGNTVGKETEAGGVVFNDIETNEATAQFASAFGSESRAAAEGAIAAGLKIPRSGANVTYDENDEQVATNPDDWRSNEAYGRGAEAFGRGAVAYSRASKSFGYRTQTGYPPSAEHAAARPEAIVQTDADGNATYPRDNVGQGAFAVGADTAALENHSFAGGWAAIARGASSFAFGDHTEAIGYASFAFGRNTKAHSGYSVAFGDGCESKGVNSFTSGNLSKANGSNAIAMGFTCVAEGDGSIALGSKNTSGVAGDTKVKFAVTAGRECSASATCAVALGYGSVANQYGQTVVGRFNAYKNDEIKNAVFAVGSGSSDTARKNAFVVNNDGSAHIAGKLSFGSIDNASREKILAPMRGQDIPVGNGDYIGQIYLMESYSYENDGWFVTEVYMYCGKDPGGANCWVKIN